MSARAEEVNVANGANGKWSKDDENCADMESDEDTEDNEPSAVGVDIDADDIRLMDYMNGNE